MSLTPEASSSSSSGISRPDVTISVETGASSNMYTVPEGRKFVGYFNTSYGSSTSAMQIVSPTGNTSGYYFGSERQAYFPITLTAGWTVRTWSYTGSIIGVESDA